MRILGIETSCDETAAAVVEDGFFVRSSITYSQIPLHMPWGGVVPEVASRAHIAKIGSVIRAALGDMKVDAVAVTYGPGLASSLLVGLNAAKGLSLSLGVPLIAVNHMEAHLHTPFLVDAPEIVESHNLGMDKSRSAGAVGRGIDLERPMLGLAVSGGHTTWIDMPRYGEYRIIGQTLDDAAGEAFDKAAKLLELGYPGGPKVDRLAKAYFAGIDLGRFGGMDGIMADEGLKALKYPLSPKLPKDAPRFPKGMPREGTAALAGLPAGMCVSFSGLKTALLYYVRQNPPKDINEKAMIVAAYQEAIVDALAARTRTALRGGRYAALAVGGGVSLNGRLRARLSDLCRAEGVELLMAAPKYCGDNAAMIAGLAYFKHPLMGEDALALDVSPTLQPGD